MYLTQTGKIATVPPDADGRESDFLCTNKKIGNSMLSTARSGFVALAIVIAPIAMSSQCNIVNGKAHGDCANVTVNTQGDAKATPLEVRSGVVETGIIGGATIHPGGTLTLSGISQGDIVVRRGGRLVVSGTVSGTIRNEGGSVDITGVVTRLVSSGGKVAVRGIVKSFSGAGPVNFAKNSFLAERAFATDTRVP